MPEQLIRSPNLEYISLFGSFASALSLIISVWLLISVRSLKSRFMAKIRLPDLLEKFDSAATEINKMLIAGNMRKTSEVLSVCKAHLKSVRAHSGFRPPASVGYILLKISLFRFILFIGNSGLCHRIGYSVYDDIRTLCVGLEHHLKDMDAEA